MTIRSKSILGLLFALLCVATPAFAIGGFGPNGGSGGGGTIPGAVCGDSGHALAWDGSAYFCQAITGVAAAGGSNGQVQYNNAGGLGGFTTSGDATINTGTGALTLATVNSNVGSFGSATQCQVQTVNAKGLTTAASQTTCTPAWSSITSTPTTLSGYGITDALSTALASTKFIVGNGSGVATAVNMSGDAALANTGGVTLATVNANVGSFGSATACPNFTVNGKGLITAAGSAPCTPAWSSITSTPTTISGYGITDALTTALANGKINIGSAGGLATAQSLAGDCTLVAAGTITCTKTNTVAFAASATTDTTNASNIGSGTLALARFPTLAADSFWLNATGSAAVPTAVAIPSCSGATNALTYNTTSHALGCNSITGGVGGSPGGLPGQIQWNNTGSFDGLTPSGDLTAVASTGVFTLATVNSNVGTFGSATKCAAVTVNGKGLTTAASEATCTPAWSSITGTPTTISGYGITDGLTTALANTKIFIGGAGGLAAAQTMSQDCTLGNTGVITCTKTNNVSFAASATSDTTNAANISSGTILAARMPAMTGDATSSAGAVALTLATVNSNVGTFGDAGHAVTLTVNAKGLVTAASSSQISQGAYYIANNFYFALNSSLAASAVFSTTTTRYTPFYIPYTITISQLGAKVITTTSGNFVMGIYANGAANQPTGAVLQQTGNMSTASAAVVMGALGANVQLTPGIYWIATQMDNTTATLAAMNVVSTTEGFMVGAATSTSLSGSSNQSGLAWTATSTYGTFASNPTITESSNTSSQQVVPIFKVASVP